jgi:hypothetical protein
VRKIIQLTCTADVSPGSSCGSSFWGNVNEPAEAVYDRASTAGWTWPGQGRTRCPKHPADQFPKADARAARPPTQGGAL